MSATDVSKKVLSPITPFSDVSSLLTKLLDSIKSASSLSKISTTQASLGSVVVNSQLHAKTLKAARHTSVSAEAGKAYGDGYGKAKDALKKVIDKLTPTQVDFMSGLGFTDPNDDAKKRTDILNSVISSWDAAAAKYMNGHHSEGDAARKTFHARIREFDDTLLLEGKPPVTPDK